MEISYTRKRVSGRFGVLFFGASVLLVTGERWFVALRWLARLSQLRQR